MRQEGGAVRKLIKQTSTKGSPNCRNHNCLWPPTLQVYKRDFIDLGTCLLPIISMYSFVKTKFTSALSRFCDTFVYFIGSWLEQNNQMILFFVCKVWHNNKVRYLDRGLEIHAYLLNFPLNNLWPCQRP